jgi:hypothetical protein
MEFPLNSFWKGPEDMPDFDPPRTSNSKGYSGHWQIRDGRLFLTRLEATLGHKPFAASRLFSGRELPVLASWYSGPLNIPTGKRMNNDRYAPRFAKLVILEVSKGRIVSTVARRNARIASR